MRKYGRRDANHAPILNALRQIGAGVIDTADLGDDLPDAVVAYQGHCWAMEIKTEKGRLTPGQERWLSCWPGETAIVRSVAEAIAIVTGRQL